MIISLKYRLNLYSAITEYATPFKKESNMDETKEAEERIRDRATIILTISGVNPAVIPELVNLFVSSLKEKNFEHFEEEAREIVKKYTRVT